MILANKRGHRKINLGLMGRPLIYFGFANKHLYLHIYFFGNKQVIFVSPPDASPKPLANIVKNGKVFEGINFLTEWTKEYNS